MRQYPQLLFDSVNTFAHYKCLYSYGWITNPTERGAYIRTIRMIRGLRLVGFVIRRHGV